MLLLVSLLLRIISRSPRSPSVTCHARLSVSSPTGGSLLQLRCFFFFLPHSLPTRDHPHPTRDPSGTHTTLVPRSNIYINSTHRRVYLRYLSYDSGTSPGMPPEPRPIFSQSFSSRGNDPPCRSHTKQLLRVSAILEFQFQSPLHVSRNKLVWIRYHKSILRHLGSNSSPI